MRFLGFTPDEWHILFVGALWLGTIPTLIYSYRKVSAFRRGLYVVALPVSVMMAYIYGGSFLRHYDIVLPGSPGFLLRIAVFLLALEFYLVPYVDRTEKRTGVALAEIGEASNQLESQLRSDQQATMDSQNQVMTDQRIVMQDQREGMAKDDGE